MRTRTGRGSPAWVNLGLLLANLVVFAVELSQGPELELFLHRWGLVPADVAPGLSAGLGSGLGVLVTFVTSSFLHAGWLHLAVNLLYLGFFGGAVEWRLGHGRYLVLYLICAVASGLAESLAQPEVAVPVIGASGAIAGVIAAHLVLFPGGTLGTLVPVLFFQPVEDVPALLLLLLWLVAQFFSGVAAITASSGIAWWAHVGGFLAGLVLAPLVRPRQRVWW